MPDEQFLLEQAQLDLQRADLVCQALDHALGERRHLGGIAG